MEQGRHRRQLSLSGYLTTIGIVILAFARVIVVRDEEAGGEGLPHDNHLGIEMTAVEVDTAVRFDPGSENLPGFVGEKVNEIVVQTAENLQALAGVGNIAKRCILMSEDFRMLAGVEVSNIAGRYFPICQNLQTS